MWLVILITLVIGALGEACLGKASRQHFSERLNEQSKRLLKVSSWLTIASVLGFLGVQFYYQGFLMLAIGFMQLVAGAFLMQRFLAKPALSPSLRINFALFSGPVCITLLMVVVKIFQQ